MSQLLVLLTGAVIVGAGLLTVTRRNPIHAALSMLIALAGVALVMLALRSPFLAAMQVLLYGGAIMVLFVFVIMLLTLRDEELGPEPPTRQKLAAALGSLVLLLVLCFAISARSRAGESKAYELPYHTTEREVRLAELDRKAKSRTPDMTAAEIEAAKKHLTDRRTRVDFGTTEHFSRFLYTDYAVPFELITVLVMAAVAGVIVLARRPERVTLERTRLTGGGQA